MSVNKVILVGHLGRDPEVRYSPSGAPVCTFSVATTERWKDKSGEQKELTQWTNIVAWNKLAEIAGEHLRKGSQLYLEGRLQTREYTDKQGVKKYVTEVIADTIRFLGGGARGQQQQGQEHGQGYQQEDNGL